MACAFADGTSGLGARGNRGRAGHATLAFARARTTTMGARYDVWCPPTPGGTLYLWALFEGVRTPPRMCTVMFDGGVFPLSVPPYVGGGRMEAHNGAGGSSSDLRSSTVIASGTVDVPIEADVSGGAGGATGTVDVWVGLQDESCPMSMDRPAPVYVLGLGARRALPDR